MNKSINGAGRSVGWQRVTEQFFGRHSHRAPYAAVLFDGSYRETGDHGAFVVTPGFVMLHEAFESHSDRFGPRGAWILDIPLPPIRFLHGGLAQVGDPDEIARIAEGSPQDAGEFLLSNIVPCHQEPSDTNEVLAAQLARDPNVSLGRFAADHGIRPWTLSRDFFLTFGISPRDFRTRSKARMAWNMVQHSDLPLSTISHKCGFSDQPHMTRCVSALTGLTPGRWRGRRYRSYPKLAN